MTQLIAKISESDQDLDYVSQAALTIGGTVATATPPHNLPGDAIAFTAASGVIDVTNDDCNFAVTDPFSVCFWVYLPSTPTSFGTYISRQQASGNFVGWTVATPTSRGRVALTLRQDASNQHSIQSDYDIPTGQWVHVAITYNGLADFWGTRIYFNATQQDTATVSATLSTSETITAAGINLTVHGRQATASNFGVAVTMDDVRVYAGELTPEQVAEIYEEARPNDNWAITKCVVGEPRAGVTSDWFGRSVYLLASNGVLTHYFRDAPSHASTETTGKWHVQFSADKGRTWTPINTTLAGAAVTGFPLIVQNTDDCPHDIEPIEAPNGDWLLFVSYFDGSRHGVHIWRSTNDGATWTQDTQMTVAGLNDDGIVAGGQAVVIDGVIYFATWYDPTPATGDGPHRTILLSSDDNGTTWTHVADVTDEDTNSSGECGLADLGGGRLLVVAKQNDGIVKTYARTVTTDGTLGNLREIQSQVGAMQRPKLAWLNSSALLLYGRSDAVSAERTVFYVSRDEGASWGEPLTLDAVDYEDAGYVGLIIDEDRIVGTTYIGTEDKAPLCDFELRYKGYERTSSSASSGGGQLYSTIYG